MELQAVTGELYIVDGTVMQATEIPGMIALSAPSKAVHGRSHDFLFLHLTLSGQLDDTATLAQDLLDSISSIYYSTPGSVTAAIRKAVIETNKLLLGHNLSAVGTTHEGALNCAVLRGQELFMSQVGEAFALIGHNFGVERLPASQPSRITPLGRTAGLDSRFTHHWLQPGTTLLMADPRLAHLSSEALKPVLLDLDVEDGLQLLTRIVGSESARILLVEFTDEPPLDVPDAARPVVASTSRRNLSPPTGQPIRESTQPRPVRAASQPGTGLASLDVELVETTARKATSVVARRLSRLTAWLAKLLATLYKSEPGTEQHSGWALPALLAILIPIVIAAVVTGVYFQRGQVLRFGEIRQEMNRNLALGKQAGTDSGAAELFFRQTLILAAEAERLRPGDDEIQRLRSEALEALDDLSGVARLTSQLIHQFPDQASASVVALGDPLNGGIYVLDTANSQVFQLETGEEYSELSAEPQLILFREQVVGNHVVSQIIDMMWRPRGNAVTRDGMAMLDRLGALVTFFPNFSDTRAVPLGLASDWQRPRAIASFNERLYVLDNGAELIWRYFADGDGFTLSDEQRFVEFVEDADLDRAADVAIYAEDGSVVLAYEDGRLRRYARGRLLWSEAELANNGLATPLISPAAVKIVGQGLNSSIFVLDPGSERIVQFSLGGTFLAQFKALNDSGLELFGSAADFAVAENPLRIFVLSANGLYLAQ